MSGPTLTATVLPTVETSQPFSSSTRSPSHSTPDLLSNPEHAQTQSTRLDFSRTRSLSTKSLPTLPAFDLPAFDFNNTDLDTTLSFSSEFMKDSPNEKSTIIRAENDMAGPESRISKAVKRRNTISRAHSWIPSSKGSLHITENALEGTEPEASRNVETGGSKFLSPNSQDTYRSVSDSLSFLTKRSWMPGSRSPSPGDRNEESEPASLSPSPDVRPGRERSASNSSIMKLRKSSRKRPVSPAGSNDSKSGDSRSKFGTYLNRLKQRQPAILMKGKFNNDHDSPGSSTASLAPPSTETRQSHASDTSNSTFPEDIMQTKLPQSRDSLWLAFKTLDTDFHTFQVKSTNMRMNLIRTTLVPFLRNYSNHPSNRMLHHEDLERRALILNKWWNGLLELFEGKNQQPVPGVDRPMLLEAITSLMTRPEWRQCTASFSPLADRNNPERLQRQTRADASMSSTSVDSTDSAYLAESARHNVKTMFITNLVAQMAATVEKLSLRHAPLSLVNFAGKACAYAFFFAPGIADVLVRLWSLTPDLIRRVADEFGLPRHSRGESDDLVALFPPCVERLGWTSVRTLSDSLKKAATLPLTAAKIPWRGSWISRWTGRDTDLFFIFCKYYYILADDFMPAGLSLAEKARAPGFVLVNAQVLSILDSTIHRQAAVEAMMGPPLADATHGADASAMTLPSAPNNNIMKGMNENRLIVLLKDFLFTTSFVFGAARHTFAEAFMSVMKASAKRTSQYDHNACFTFCDFLEESLPAYEDFDSNQNLGNAYVDWPFWLEVCKKILRSNNTMSEIRVLSLIFSIWEAIAKNQARKGLFCVKWLLTEEVFNMMFNNWCPMVRAYYMRLLCWRICRDAGSANESDAKIFLVVYSRLKTVWSHYLWLKQTSEQQCKFPPSTAPSYPTPGKRFMIIRTEYPVAQPGLLIGFDSSAPPQQSNPSNPATDFDSMESMDSADDEPTSQRKKGSILGKIFSFSGNATVSNDLEAVRRETAALRTRPTLPPKGPASPPVSDTDSTGSSPTYEDMQYIFRFTLSWNPAGTQSPPNRILTRPRLPAPAHSWVTAKGRTGSPPPPPAGRPAPTRAVSGSPNPGLVNSAKNADPSEVPISPHRISMAFDRRQSFSQMSPVDQSNDDVPLRSPVTPTSRGKDEAVGFSPITPAQESIIMPVEPKGAFAAGVKYAGRALAEWSLVVAECNSFVDRRRDEGVFGLSEVEVPTLGVEGFRKPT
ncbi:DUF1765-domain-containing protein [Hypoxylon rubiginosum]|uniref:DUF1765-domain-containing protein n=1 Tax=Hypoxylon rubiginosum TaxID=110542 RepID=A0ACB9YP96_9PEZI|nr:DUF1765-domain-containing protein [Hypoxylon rubiginosum]